MPWGSFAPQGYKAFQVGVLDGLGERDHGPTASPRTSGRTAPPLPAKLKTLNPELRTQPQQPDVEFYDLHMSLKWPTISYSSRRLAFVEALGPHTPLS